MREIKFRAWDKDNNCMVYGWYEITEEKCAKDRFLGRQAQTLATEVMQYTGLKDKNGKEIYEGDLVAYEDCVLLIEWGEDCAGFGYEIISQKNKNVIHDIRLYRSDESFEVIGNIYKNPEASK